jgi:hypothetical protein
MRFDNSADGQLRATVGIRFRVGRTELACALFRRVEYLDNRYEPDAAREYLAKQSRTSVEAALRDGLEERGYLLFESSDLDEEETELVIERVDELFPELRVEVAGGLTPSRLSCYCEDVTEARKSQRIGRGREQPPASDYERYLDSWRRTGHLGGPAYPVESAAQEAWRRARDHYRQEVGQ